MKKFKWISDFLKHPKQFIGWESLSDILPNEFDDYFLIHWNVGIVENYPFEDYPEQLESIEEINEGIRIDKENNLFFNPNVDQLFKQTTLKKIALMFSQPYDRDLLYNIKQTPAIKLLGAETIVNLKKTIHQLSKGEKLNLFVLDDPRNYIFAEHNKEEPKQLMSDISVEEYFYWQEWFNFDYYTYLFPSDRKWCLTTSEGLPMFLCLNKELNVKELADNKVELFRIKYDESFY